MAHGVAGKSIVPAWRRQQPVRMPIGPAIAEPTVTEPHRRRGWVPWLVGGGFFLLTAVVAVYIAITAEAQDRERFDNLVQRSRWTIADRLDSYVAVLRSTSGLFASAPETTLRQFRTYVDRLRLGTAYPGVQVIGFSRRVPNEEREAFVARLQRKGVRGFRMWPEHEGAEHHSII